MARQYALQTLPASATATAVNPANFVSAIDNPYFALAPGETYHYQSEDGSTVETFAVTRQTIKIQGVTCVVVRHISVVDGVLHEDTFDYFAQDNAGNVWYFGEAVKNYDDNGVFTDTDGSWKAGVDGAEPGIIMQANPQVGQTYNQENAPGIAEDMATVLSLTQPVDVPYGAFDQALQTKEFTPLEPALLEHKYYVAGVGHLLVVNVNTGEQELLTKIQIDGTTRHDALFGKLGTDELNGKAGNDSLDGLGGSDTVMGGLGHDFLNGAGDDAADYLYGEQGNDEIQVGAGDEAHGGAGNDELLLFDNVDFGLIAGGAQVGRNLRAIEGDVLEFENDLDLTAAGVSERISGIETLSMDNDQGGDSLKLGLADVLNLGDGVFRPRHGALGDAVRVDGDAGDQVMLAGGNWTAIAMPNAPADYLVFASQGPSGPAYVLVEQEVTVVLG